MPGVVGTVIAVVEFENFGVVVEIEVPAGVEEIASLVVELKAEHTQQPAGRGPRPFFLVAHTSVYRCTLTS